jgi:hypothetical protein
MKKLLWTVAMVSGVILGEQAQAATVVDRGIYNCKHYYEIYLDPAVERPAPMYWNGQGASFTYLSPVQENIAISPNTSGVVYGSPLSGGAYFILFTFNQGPIPGC